MSGSVRPLVSDDLDWVVEVTRRRRERLVPHAPRFWNPAPDATARHRAFLAHLVADPDTLSVRTDHGYLIAVQGARGRVVDDMVVTDGAWTTEGAVLLQHVLDVGDPVRFVAPIFETERSTVAEALGLAVSEVWWHRDLPPAQIRAAGDRVQLEAAGATGRLVPAPPVYDPGGSVLLVTEVRAADALAAVEREAGMRGATVAVVTQRPDDLMRELLLVDAGYTLTTRFYE